jgi:hypothetical protein
MTIQSVLDISYHDMFRRQAGIASHRAARLEVAGSVRRVLRRGAGRPPLCWRSIDRFPRRGLLSSEIAERSLQ